MKQRKAYRFRMEPTPSQAKSMVRMAGARRFVYNWALQQRQDYYGETGKTMPAALLSSKLTVLKHEPETAWLREADSQLLQQSLKDVDRAFVNFFERRARYPHFRSRKRDALRFRIPQRVKLVGGKVYVPKVGWVRVRQSQEVPEGIKSATFKQDAAGHWHVTLVAEFEIPDTPPLPAGPESVVGIDLGLKTFATLSDGVQVATPSFYRRAERKLKRAQRSLSRKQKGSSNRTKQKRRVALVHRKVAAKRNDFMHKTTTTLISRYDAYCIEDLSVKGLARTKLGKSILDASFGEFRRQMTYKALWRRKQLVVVDRWFPSSKLCGDCGATHDTLTLADRYWICPSCGAEHDRDLNAAMNLRNEGMKQLALGHRESRNACGVPVSLPMGAGDDEARILPL